MPMVTKKSHSKAKQNTVQVNKSSVTIQRGMLVHALIAIILVCIVAMAGYMGWRAVRSQQSTGRLQQIVNIYDNLKLGDSYRTTVTSIFGDKRVYEYDSSRTYASRVEYGHNDTPANTRADLRSKVQAAGFNFVQTEYEGSVQPVDEYKNDKGNWVRVSVISGYMQDALVYGNHLQDGSIISHKDEATSYVTIKVNLDDNNE
jgi:hypothetical protein